MAESTNHARLVEVLADFAKDSFQACGHYALYVDKVSLDRQECPPYVEGHVPDLLIRDVPQTRIMIGEAKTTKDLESEHSQLQIRAFLKYLQNTPNSSFVLCVPLAARATARTILKQIIDSFPDNQTQILVLDPSGKAI